MRKYIWIGLVLIQIVNVSTAFGAAKGFGNGIRIGAYLPPTIGATLNEDESRFESVRTMGAAFGENIQRVIMNNLEVEIRTLTLIE